MQHDDTDTTEHVTTREEAMAAHPAGKQNQSDKYDADRARDLEKQLVKLRAAATYTKDIDKGVVHETWEYADGSAATNSRFMTPEEEEEANRNEEPAKAQSGHAPDSYEGRMQTLREEFPDVPAYYLFPGGTQVNWISEHLTSNGGQAVQYIARATRLDRCNKGERAKDISKAIDMLFCELARIEDGGY